MSTVPTIDLIEALDVAGYSDLKVRTFKTILLIYELGALTRREIREIAGLTDKNTGGQLDRLTSMCIVVRSGMGNRWQPFEFRLHPDIRKIIERTYEKWNENTAA